MGTHVYFSAEWRMDRSPGDTEDIWMPTPKPFTCAAEAWKAIDGWARRDGARVVKVTVTREECPR